jgi:hypothetical protein
MAGKKFALTISVVALALVAAGCSSDDPAAPADTAPPAVPYNLHASYASGQVTLGWEDNVVDADYAGVLITRTVGDGDPEQITASPVATTSFQDTITDQGNIVYSAVAVDLVGNRSAAANASVFVPGFHLPGIDQD